jgi:hypothetical protein
MQIFARLRSNKLLQCPYKLVFVPLNVVKTLKTEAELLDLIGTN